MKFKSQFLLVLSRHKTKKYELVCGGKLVAVTGGYSISGTALRSWYCYMLFLMISDKEAANKKNTLEKQCELVSSFSCRVHSKSINGYGGII